MKKFVCLLSLLLAFTFQIEAQNKIEKISPITTYTRLFNAVKAKDSEAIKREMSEATLKFAEGAAEQRKQNIYDLLKNGLYASTITKKLPKMRDERIKDKYAALEVWVTKERKWEDVSFIFENGDWKIAVGDVFAGTFKSPGMSEMVRAKTKNSNRVRKNIFRIPSVGDLKKMKKLQVD
jgi:hypothetical protein